MVTNINLAASEPESNVKMSGKKSLIIAILLLLLAVAIYLILHFFAKSYQSQQANIDNQILESKNKIIGSDFADIADFQGRLGLLDTMTQDRMHFDTYLKEMSQYVLPEIHFTSLDWSGKDGTIDIKGFSPNFNSLSQAVVLLKKYPALQSIEFKKAGETTSASGGQAGVEFELSAMLKTGTLNK
jgi:Tfp pilus assembly protein PilN